MVYPKSAELDFVIAVNAIEPTVLASVADTLTAGDDCAVTGFLKLNVTTQAVSDVVPPFAAVSTSSPELCVQEPVVPRRLDVDVVAKLATSAVCELVSPVIVTVEPFARLKLAVSVTVNVFSKPAIGVLC